MQGHGPALLILYVHVALKGEPGREDHIAFHGEGSALHEGGRPVGESFFKIRIISLLEQLLKMTLLLV